MSSGRLGQGSSEGVCRAPGPGRAWGLTGGVWLAGVRALSSFLLHAKSLSCGQGWPRKPGALAGAHTRGKHQGLILGMSRVASPAWLDLTLLRLPWRRHCLWVGPSVPPGKCTSPGGGGGGGNLDTQRPPRRGGFTWSSRARSPAAGNTAGWTASGSHSVQPELLAALVPGCLPTSAGLPLLRGTPVLGFPHLHLSRALRNLTGGIFCHTRAWPMVPGGGPVIPGPRPGSPLGPAGGPADTSK